MDRTMHRQSWLERHSRQPAEFMQRAFIEPPVIAVRVLEVDRRETLRGAFLCG